jgi:hypothetical protein
MRRLYLFAGLMLLLSLKVIPGYAHSPNPQPDPYIRSDRLGIAHISSASTHTPEERYHRALTLGAGWNRWPLYWNWVEVAPGEWDWGAYDRQVTVDLEYGLNINAILLGRPEFRAEGSRIQGLNEPIFADGSDVPGPDKTLNPENPWAVFAYEAVSRYRPGGTLAQEITLPRGAGIRVWEVWNEPDYRPFWSGTVREYARLLKVAYIAVKQADPNAQVMIGGMLYPDENNWLAQVLNVYINDPMAERHNWFMDIIAIHNYANPWRSGWLALVARQTLKAYDIDRPIWLNETGVPVWDDYPGPVWDQVSHRRASSEQQAWFFVQSAAYAWSEGVDKVFYHQLYDDCGDQPAGTNFPPHSGDLCTDGFICAGDAHGMFRNNVDSVCFSQHPRPDSPRPVAQAYRLVADVFGREPFDNGRRLYLDDRFVTIAFPRPRTGERIMVMWNQRLTGAALALEAVGENGQLLSLEGSAIITPDDDGLYQIELPPAQRDNYPNPPPGAQAAIGGPPLILIELAGGEVTPVVVELDDLESQPVEITPAPPRPPPRPTTDPALDTTPPIAAVLELPAVSAPTFRVSWYGEDNSGIDRFLIWVRVDGGEWQPWLETPQTSADYTGTPGKTYEFSAWAVDLAGNWSTNVDLRPQAATRVELPGGND